ncbi:hypothetical protein HOLleu_10563 [Holothuria leucospilota]|uniref:Integrase core domain-containing protein n=1 Tax=Holothuria leucospilota TaxID=206669 RepID=A0A9Q1HEL3_HOLLE|nr:hypothetical protein HOLleu_10563 [Holothuria leucospilota]
MRQLRRIILSLRQRRRDRPLHLPDLVRALLNELGGSGQFIGYRAMWRRLRSYYNLNVTQEITRIALNLLDPVGVHLRRGGRIIRRAYTCPGPNYLIHLDGYDKLKPFGIAVHGAIDGFSRKVLWLYAGPSNNNPRFIAYFFLSYIRRLRGVPKIVRADRGTENCHLRDLQKALRWHHRDSFRRNKSFMYGRSTSNQRIEAWWGQLKRTSTNFWINLFRGLQDDGSFDNSDQIHVECLRFCFTDLIQSDFNKVLQEWNQHSIRHQNGVLIPSGKPDEMYYTPEVFGTHDYKMPLLFTQGDIDEVEMEYSSQYPPHGCSEEFLAVLNEIFGDIADYQMPSTVEEALFLYRQLVHILRE